MKAYKHLVKHCLAQGLVISVHDGEEYQVKQSNKYTDIINAIESVDISELKIRNPKIPSEKEPKLGLYVGWAQIVLGNGDDELVSDYSDNEFMNAWFNAYELTLA